MGDVEYPNISLLLLISYKAPSLPLTWRDVRTLMISSGTSLVYSRKWSNQGTEPIPGASAGENSVWIPDMNSQRHF